VPPETTHPTLLARVRDPRDAAAWREFEERYRDLIRRYCRARGLQTADAEDVSQLVLLALARALQSFRFDPARGRFRSYLGRVVDNAIRRHVARPAGAADLLETSVMDALCAVGEEARDEVWEREWMQHHLRLAMRAVRSECKPESLALFERLLSGESVADAAASTGATTEAVYKVQQRIRERLRERIAQQVRDEELPGAPSAFPGRD
jgi:RNA polymerase sigma factor (sigma-70 family)